MLPIHNVNAYTSALSMNKSCKGGFVFGERRYKSIYRCLYSYAFPSKLDLINSITYKKLRELDLGYKLFEVSTERVLTILAEIIVKKYKDDVAFRKELMSIVNKKIVNLDFKDPYFGYKRNKYGKFLQAFKNKMTKCMTMPVKYVKGYVDYDGFCTYISRKSVIYDEEEDACDD